MCVRLLVQSSVRPSVCLHVRLSSFIESTIGRMSFCHFVFMVPIMLVYFYFLERFQTSLIAICIECTNQPSSHPKCVQRNPVAFCNIFFFQKYFMMLLFCWVWIFTGRNFCWILKKNMSNNLYAFYFQFQGSQGFPINCDNKKIP